MVSLLVVACADDTDTSQMEETSDTEGSGDDEGSGSGDSFGSSTGSGSDTAGTDDGGGGGGGDTAGLDAVEEACEADCEAQFATECAPTNQNVLTCKLSCASITVQLGDFCLGEYAQWVQCRADGGYDCAYDYPTPKSNCATEQVAFSECQVDLGCKRMCDAAIDAGCGGESFDACLDACIADKEALPGYCGMYADGLEMCKALGGIECIDGEPTTQADCSYSIESIGDCIADETGDVCQGYCYIADELSCGSDCSADCQSRLADPTCGSQFGYLADCILLHGDFACTDGRLIGTDICESQNTEYEACLTGP